MTLPADPMLDQAHAHFQNEVAVLVNAIGMGVRASGDEPQTIADFMAFTATWDQARVRAVAVTACAILARAQVNKPEASR